MKKANSPSKILTFCAAFLMQTAFSQNLVPNGGFETYVNCPGYPGEIATTGWYFVQGSADYLNRCAPMNFSVPKNVFGYQETHTGDGYMGLCIYGYNEFAGVELSDALKANTCYYFEMHVSLAETDSRYTTSSFGAVFSNQQLATGTSLLVHKPQVTNASNNYPDSLGWMVTSGYFTASGGEKFLTLGNFQHDTVSPVIFYSAASIYPRAYLFIDDVSLIEVAPCEMTSISESTSANPINIFPTLFDDQLRVRSNSGEKFEIFIYSLRNEKKVHTTFTSETLIETNNLPSGVYFYEIKRAGVKSQRGKIVKQ